MKKKRLTKEQSKALKEYRFRFSEEDRFLGSVFVTPSKQREYEERTKKAYEACKALGLTHEHGL